MINIFVMDDVFEPLTANQGIIRFGREDKAQFLLTMTLIPVL